eukprot:3785050-Rhodomonas_salina.1
MAAVASMCSAERLDGSVSGAIPVRSTSTMAAFACGATGNGRGSGVPVRVADWPKPLLGGRSPCSETAVVGDATRVPSDPSRWASQSRRRGMSHCTAPASKSSAMHIASRTTKTPQSVSESCRFRRLGLVPRVDRRRESLPHVFCDHHELLECCVELGQCVREGGDAHPCVGPSLMESKVGTELRQSTRKVRVVVSSIAPAMTMVLSLV